MSEIDVRWATDDDLEVVSSLMELNGRPRWEAFESRFVVAGKGGRVLAAMPYRDGDGRVFAGEVVVDPWGGERELSVAVYRAAVRLAAGTGAAEVRVRDASRAEYLVQAGYRHGLRGWTADIGEGNGRRSRPAFRERIGHALGRTSIPGM